MSDNLLNNSRTAAKWAVTAEVAAKVLVPVTQLLLARLLAPEAFGVLASVVMISSFAEMIADAGFPKYLVQYQFQSKSELHRAANVSFWTSMVLGLAMIAVIILFRDNIANLIGNPDLGFPLAVASLSIPAAVMTSTQQALFRRDFQYKKLLPIRIAVAATPLVVSVPLALAGFGYWSLIIGTVLASLVNAVYLTLVSDWKPGRYFSFNLLKKMFSFSSWTMLEAISIWATLWSGTFIVGNVLTSHELGLYRQPMLIVNSAFAIVTNATSPILFAALSRLQTERTEFRDYFLRFQLAASVVILPVGVGAFFYRDFFVTLLFGDRWSAASLMFGIWALTSSSNILLAHYYSEVFRALGKPKVSLLAQCIYMAAMIPALYFAAIDGFTTLVIVNGAIRLFAIIVNQTLAYLIADIGFIRVISSISPTVIATLVMGGFAAWSSAYADGAWIPCTLGIVGSAAIYFVVCTMFRRTRKLLFAAFGAVRQDPL